MLYYDDDEEAYASPEPPFVTEGEGYDMLVGNPCRHGRFRLEPHVDSRDEFYLLANGSLIAPFLFDHPLGTDEFCMDVFPDTENGDVMVLPLICFPPPEGARRSGLQFILYPIGLLLSVPFLLTTFILYAMTPALRDVHGKALMCQTLCLCVAYLTLAFVQLWGSSLNGGFCFGVACVVQFSFVACFLWLNVMCINTWYNMALRPAQRWCRRTERRRFVLYSMYAWSLPCLLLGVTLVMDLTPTIPSSYVKPRFGVDFCWFQTDRAALPYFYAPVTFLVMMNVVLFVLTGCSVHRRRRRRALDASATALTNDTCYKRHSNTAFRSSICLFGAMGLNWIMEIVSFYVGGPAYLWYATDVLNCMQGVWTFIIFVLNRPARREISARIRELRAGRRGDEYRVPEQPQIDDFQTVVNRQSRLVSILSPWQQEVRAVQGLHHPDKVYAVPSVPEPRGGVALFAAEESEEDEVDGGASVTAPLRTSMVPPFPTS
ncbi:G-protein coupled receptor Mth2 [Frankliniella fusca]|uniref:G-protein coupled receptor Mth2 n=1 Tax=Frankliniella fusca TaxID=407009 RepID=A0AAE1H5D9_9NEOP|nr:G-protein coupled receptor Mth2 [Frankliniella fusca]